MKLPSYRRGVALAPESGCRVRAAATRPTRLREFACDRGGKQWVSAAAASAKAETGRAQMDRPLPRSLTTLRLPRRHRFRSLPRNGGKDTLLCRGDKAVLRVERESAERKQASLGRLATCAEQVHKRRGGGKAVGKRMDEL